MPYQDRKLFEECELKFSHGITFDIEVLFHTVLCLFDSV